MPLDSVYTYKADGSGVHVYVLDTGINTSVQDFDGRAVVGTDTVGGAQNGQDCNGHGTHTAGTVGGTKYGIAKNASLVSVRVLGCNGNGTFGDVIEGVDWVTANAIKPAVANMSLGGGVSSTLDTAVQNSIASGVAYTISAGNGVNGIGVDACNVSPARVINALTVGATSTSDARAGFSNYGTCVDLFAPGVNIPSDWYVAPFVKLETGTSMSAPHVAGAAALYLERNPVATPAAVAAALTANATTGVVTNLPASPPSPNRLLYTGFLPNGPPNPPQLAAEPEPAAVRLVWTIPTDGGTPITGFKVYRGTTPGGEGPTPIASLGPTVTNHDDAGLANGTTYYYQVSAVTSLPAETRSAEVAATPAALPGTPTLTASVDRDCPPRVDRALRRRVATYRLSRVPRHHVGVALRGGDARPRHHVVRRQRARQRDDLLLQRRRGERRRRGRGTRPSRQPCRPGHRSRRRSPRRWSPERSTCRGPSRATVARRSRGTPSTGARPSAVPRRKSAAARSARAARPSTTTT